MKKFFVLSLCFTLVLSSLNLLQGQVVVKYCPSQMIQPGVCPKDPKQAEFVCLKAFFNKYGATKAPDNCVCKASNANQHICKCDIICDPPPPPKRAN